MVLMSVGKAIYRSFYHLDHLYMIVKMRGILKRSFAMGAFYVIFFYFVYKAHGSFPLSHSLTNV